MIHKTVLLHETINELEIKKGDIVFDGTLGSGGHAKEILSKLKEKITLIGFDLDQEAIERSKANLKAFQKEFNKSIFFLNESFKNIQEIKELGFNSIDKAILDLGLSSDQLETSSRGFSFQKDEPLLMTFQDDKNGRKPKLTASDIVNTFSQKSLENVIFGYGEEQFAKKISKSIVKNREENLIISTYQLAEVIKNSVPSWYRKRKIHPATKTFQALRIATNNELGVLESGLKNIFDFLNPEGRLAVISFHSLEERIVKKYFKELVLRKKGEFINKKPITPSRQEVIQNSRSRSAKLRIIKKLK